MCVGRSSKSLLGNYLYIQSTYFINVYKKLSPIFTLINDLLSSSTWCSSCLDVLFLCITS